MSEAALLQVHDLSVTFGTGESTVRAVKNVSFDIGRGETVALVGESGSGKSVTALSVLQLLPYPTAKHPTGSIRFQDRELIGAPARELLAVRGNRVSMIFQEPMTSLNPLHTIERQVNEVLILHKGLTRDAARKRTLELLDQVGIPNAIERLGAYPHQLSGGQRQRVMVARALLLKPRIIVADEPVSMVDASLRATILQSLLKLYTDFGISLVYITHDLTTAYHISKSIIVLYRGAVMEAGDVDVVACAKRRRETPVKMKE